MPIPNKYLADFTEGDIYHIYNRTNNKELLFLCDDDRKFFLQQYDKYLSPFLDTYCWCLLPNHFHLLSRIKMVEKILERLALYSIEELTMTESRFLKNQNCLSILIEQSFKRLFQSYSINFNNSYTRKGNLFYRPFKRVTVDENEEFTRAVTYIHTNPVKHGLTKDFMSYNWSSWQTIVSEEPTLLLRDELIQRFGGKELMIKSHLEMSELLVI